MMIFFSVRRSTRNCSTGSNTKNKNPQNTNCQCGCCCPVPGRDATTGTPPQRPLVRPRRGRCGFVATPHDAWMTTSTITTISNNNNNSTIPRMLRSRATVSSSFPSNGIPRIHNTTNANPTESMNSEILISSLSTTGTSTTTTESKSKQRRRTLHKAATSFHNNNKKKKKKYTKPILRNNHIQTNEQTLKTNTDVIITTTEEASVNSSSCCCNMITDDSSFSDTNHRPRKKQKITAGSKLPQRTRIPTNFYHTSVPGRTTDSTSKSHSMDNDRNQQQQHDIPTTIRSQRQRKPTDFFTPSNGTIRTVLQQSSRNFTNVTSATTTNDIEQFTSSSFISTRGRAWKKLSTKKNVSKKKSIAVIANEYTEELPRRNFSHETLLADYHQRVALGHCFAVSFGTTLSSALLVIDRKIQHLQSRNCYQTMIDDKEVIADLREYKRSLRAFSVYEDREKLASIHEVQEHLESWGRQYATMTTQPKKNHYKTTTDCTWDHHNIETELLRLEKHPIVIATGTRMMSRSAFKCPNGIHCIFGCLQKTTCDDQRYDCRSVLTTTNAIVAPIPHIQPFSMDDDDDTGDDATHHKARIFTATIDSLRELKSSLQFIATYPKNDKYFSSVDVKR